MFGKHLKLLLLKSGRYMWRRKCWTISDILLPILITVPLTYLVTSHVGGQPKKINETLFGGMDVTGDWKDIQRLGAHKTIYQEYCLTNKTLGIAFRNEQNKEEAAKFKNLLEERYNMPESVLNISVQLFDSEEDLDAELKNDLNSSSGLSCGKYIGGIVFKEFSLLPAKLKYILRFREKEGYSSKWYTGNDQWVKGGPFEILSDTESVIPGFPNYWYSGFLSLQYAVDSIFIQRVRESANATDLGFAFRLNRMPEPAYYSKEAMIFAKFLSIIWATFAIPFVVHTTAAIASEKESGMKAYLEVMGLDVYSYYFSYTVVGFIKIAVVFVPCALMLLPCFVVVSPSLFLAATLVYSMGITSFAMLLSSVFHKSGSAVRGSLLIWIALLIVNAVVPLLSNSYSIMGSLLASLSINFAMAKAVDAMMDYANRDMPLGWSNCFAESALTFTFGLAFLMMIFDIIWMTLLMFYLDNVYPPGDLPRKDFLYFLPSLRKENKVKESLTDCGEDEMDANDNVQQDDGSLNSDFPDIDVHRLTKIYDSLRAVDSLSFRAYRGKVAVLLGHNGAGKSTTFAMLTGLTKPSGGSIRICGATLSGASLAECQKNIGFCPQYNPIFDYLTVREHLQFFRELKNNPDDSVEELIEELQLSDKANVLAKDLSGGMKRKLTVGMSLVGGSRIVLLDEPTAGMDPGARHVIGELIERYKQDRTVLLTTHYMDEADLLGDRISIMVRGRLACAGTSEFLKARFGTGYLLSLALKETSLLPNRMDALMKAICSQIPNAKIQSSTVRQLTALLPVEHKARFSRLFSYLEVNGSQYGIDSFGLSLNTLEQVFINVGEMAEPTPANYDAIDVARRQASVICDQSAKTLSGARLWFTQVCALLQKRAVHQLRRWPRLIPQIVIPLLLLAGFAFLMNYHAKKDYVREVILDAGELSPAVIPFQLKNSSYFATNILAVINSVPGYEILSVAKEYDMTHVLLERPKVLPALGVAAVADTFESIPSVTAFFNAKARHGPVIASTIVSNARLGTSKNSIVVSLYPYDLDSNSEPSVPFDSSTQSILLSPLVIIIFSLLASGFIMFIVDERRCNFVHQQLLTGVSPVTFWLSTVLSDFIVYAVACSLFLTIFTLADWMTDSKGTILLLWLLYFWAFIPFTYSAGSLFVNPSKAYAAITCVSLVTPIIANIIFAIVFGVIQSPNLSSILDNIFMLTLPSYALASALVRLNNPLLLELYVWDGLGRVMCMMSISGLIFWLIFFAIKTRFLGRLLHTVWKIRYRHAHHIGEPIDEDDDVKVERRMIENGSDGDFAICLRGVEKYYGSLHAVKNLTFGVRPDECFGLLGVNGAGKTSTFDILTGVSLRDGGTATVNGRSVDERQMIGFCPQFDALLEDLTARETLSLMVALRGFTDKASRVRSVLDAVSLTAHADKPVSCFSGGQRRRLSMGLALISQARVVLLDEPTAGIDPKARRQIWNLLSAMREQSCAMLITSHSMDECEALCTRIGIMHNGALTAIGSAQHIKSRFGEGYTMTMTLRDIRGKDRVIDAVAKQFPRASLKTLHPTIHLIWHIAKSSDDRWSVLFDGVHKFATSQPDVVDYSLAQATLEEAFLRLSRNDDEENAAQVQRNASLDVSTLV